MSEHSLLLERYVDLLPRPAGSFLERKSNRATIDATAREFSQMAGMGLIFGMTESGLVVGVRQRPRVVGYKASSDFCSAITADLSGNPDDTHKSVQITIFTEDQAKIVNGTVKQLPSSSIIEELENIPDGQVPPYLLPQLSFYERTGGVLVASPQRAGEQSLAGGQVIYPLIELYS